MIFDNFSRILANGAKVLLNPLLTYMFVEQSKDRIALRYISSLVTFSGVESTVMVGILDGDVCHWLRTSVFAALMASPRLE